MKKSWIKILIVVFILFVVAYVFWLNFVTRSTIIVQVDTGAEITEISVTINGKPLSILDAKELRYSGSVGAGEHNVLVTAPGYTGYSGSINTFIRKRVVVDAKLDNLSPKEVATSIYHTEDGLEIVNPKFFGNKDWLIFTVSQLQGNGGIAIAKLNAETQKWHIVVEGTDIDPIDKRIHEAPAELIEYLRTGI